MFKNKNQNGNTSVILMFFVLLLIAAIGMYFVSKYMLGNSVNSVVKNSSILDKQQPSTPNSTSLQPQPKEIATTIGEAIYVGPRPYRLEYIDNGSAGSTYILREIVHPEKYVVLQKNNTQSCPLTDPPIVSPDHTKFILTGSCGDGADHWLMGVKKEFDRVEEADVLTPVSLNFHDVYRSRFTTIIAWLNNDFLLTKEVYSDTYWYVKPTDLENKKLVKFDF